MDNTSVSTRDYSVQGAIISLEAYQALQQDLSDARRACEISHKRWHKSLDKAAAGQPRYLRKTPEQWRDQYDRDVRAYRNRYNQYVAIYNQYYIGIYPVIPI